MSELKSVVFHFTISRDGDPVDQTRLCVDPGYGTGFNHSPIDLQIHSAVQIPLEIKEIVQEYRLFFSRFPESYWVVSFGGRLVRVIR